MSDDLRWREQLSLLEQQTSARKQDTQRLRDALAAHEQRCAAAALALRTVNGLLTHETERREKLRARLQLLHDSTYAKLAQGDGAKVLETMAAKTIERLRNQND
jgi:hypothetical protein